MSAVLNERPTAKGTSSDTTQQRAGVTATKSPRASKKAAKAPATTSPVTPVAEAVAEAAVADAGIAPHDVLVPLDKLLVSGANVRTVAVEAGIPELAALIFSQGLLQRLLVVATPDGKFAVVAGGRRLRAMQLLVTEGKWSPAQPIECRLFPNERAAELSLAENSGRADMHPADQMEAFRTVIEQGATVAQVADRFGVSVLTVERRLKLARLAPRFLQMYRDDDIRPDQLMALTLSEDHAAQEAVWDGMPEYGRSAHSLRRALTEQSCEADSRLGRFVGVTEYEARGGPVRRDLFSQSSEDGAGVYLDDSVLLQTLAMEKLRAHAERIRAEGWSWVDCLTDSDGMALRQFGRETVSEREPTEADKQVFEGLQAEREALDAAWDRLGESDEDNEAEYEATEAKLSATEAELDARLEAAQEALQAWTPEQMARSGALLRIDYEGELLVDRGLVRAEGTHGGHPDGATGSGEVGSAASGPNGTPGAGVSADGKKQRPEFSEKLMRDLTSHRTAALQAALMRSTDVALVVVVHTLAERVFSLYDRRGADVVKIQLTPNDDQMLAQAATGYADSPAGTMLSRAADEWGDLLPGTSAGLFQYLLNLERDQLLELLAYCTARSIDAVAGRERGYDHSDAIAQAVGLDMADWWVPTADNYLSQVSKAKAQEAVTQATGKDPSKELDGLKKQNAVTWCATRMEGTRWLPAPLRPFAPLSAVPAAAEEAAPDADAEPDDEAADEEQAQDA